MPETVHEDLRISYEVSGSGEPVLFLPGTALDSSSWLVSVATHLSDFRAVMIDPRDTPKSDRAGGPYTPADLAAEALAVLDAAGADRAHLVGYSLGGAAAQEVALAAPERVLSLTLVCTWARSDAFMRHVFELLRDGLRSGSTEWTDRALLWLTLSAEYQAGPAYQPTLEILSGRGQAPEALARQLGADIAHDAAGRLSSLSVPTLVVGGEDDIFVPARYSRELADLIPGARLKILAEGSHGIPIEMQEEFFSLLREHIGSIR